MENLKRTLTYIFKNKPLFFIVVLGWILTLLPTIFDGHYGCLQGQCGFIVGTNYRDGIWYLAVAAASFVSIPFRMPNYAGAALQGYHFLPNLLTFLLSKIGIPITISFYQLFPLVYMGLLTYFGIFFARRVKDDSRFVSIFMFFAYFGIPFTAFTSYYHFHRLQNSLIINTFQTTRILESIHAGFAYVILVIVMLILSTGKLKKKKRIFLGTLIFLLFGIKFYTALIVLVMVAIYEIASWIKSRQTSQLMLAIAVYFVATLISVLLFYNPFVTLANGPIFIFSPFAAVHHIIESHDYFYLPRLVDARYFLYTKGWGPRLLAIELFSTVLYVVFYMGTRIVGLWDITTKTLSRKLSAFDLSLIGGMVFGLGMSVLFVQRGDWFNPMQFAVYACLIMNYFAARTIYEFIISKNRALLLLAAVLIVVTMPMNLLNLGYLWNPSRYVIPQNEMVAMAFLKKMPDGPVFVPIDKYDMDYVSAFTGKQTYLNYVILIDNSGIKADDRKKLVSNIDFDVNKLHVKYLYVPKTYLYYKRLVRKFTVLPEYKTIYENKGAIILENTRFKN